MCPQVASLYNPGSDFRCFDGSNTIPFIQVNDDYCDCEVNYLIDAIKVRLTGSKCRTAQTNQAPLLVPMESFSVRMLATRP